MEQLLQSEESHHGAGYAPEAACTVAEGYSASTATLPRLLRNISSESVRRSRHIAHWDPEDLSAWEAGNNIIAAAI
jgi:hypothetical protein